MLLYRVLVGRRTRSNISMERVLEEQEDVEEEARVIQEEGGNQVKLLRSFNRLNLPIFDGKRGPDSWLYNVGEKLELIGVPDSLRPRIAANKMTGFSHSWWRIRKGMSNINSWDQFCKEYERQFISDA